MGFMTTILEKTVILCAQVYLLVIMLMILGFRWWQMMAMKDFQIWVLATCSLPSMPALDALDEAISSPSLPALQHRHRSCSKMTERFDSLPQGNSAPLISNPTPRQLCCGSRGNHSGCKELEGLGVTWTALMQLWESLASFPCLSTAFVFIPTQGKISRSLAEGAQKVKIWRNSQDFGWKICKGCNVQSPSLTPWVRVTSTWFVT